MFEESSNTWVTSRIGLLYYRSLYDLAAPLRNTYSTGNLSRVERSNRKMVSETCEWNFAWIGFVKNIYFSMMGWCFRLKKRARFCWRRLPLGGNGYHRSLFRTTLFICVHSAAPRRLSMLTRPWISQHRYWFCVKMAKGRCRWSSYYVHTLDKFWKTTEFCKIIWRP